MEGPFTNERFPDFASDYPLLLLGEEGRQARNGSGDNQGVVLKGPRSSQSRPKKKGSVRVVGSVRLRIGVTASSSPTGSRVIHDGSDGKGADSAAVGDGDTPEICRRRTNTVDRRLRLGVGWVSLVRLFGLAPSSVVCPTKKGTKLGEITASDSGDVGQSGDIGAKRPRRQSRQRSVAFPRASSSEPADSEPAEAEHASTRAAGRLGSLLPMTMSGISCRVIWCGVCVTSFELCPKTGLPLTPGECLLELPRGTAWTSCQLVLEVVATDQCMREALEHSRRLHSQDGLDCDTSTPQANDGPHHVLGRVTVDWQVRGDGKVERYIRPEVCSVVRDDIPCLMLAECLGYSSIGPDFVLVCRGSSGGDRCPLA